MVNEPSVFGPLKFYSLFVKSIIAVTDILYFRPPFHKIQFPHEVFNWINVVCLYFGMLLFRKQMKKRKKKMKGQKKIRKIPLQSFLRGKYQ